MEGDQARELRLGVRVTGRGNYVASVLSGKWGGGGGQWYKVGAVSRVSELRHNCGRSVYVGEEGTHWLTQPSTHLLERCSSYHLYVTDNSEM